MKVVTRERTLFVLYRKDEGLFCLSFIFRAGTRHVWNGARKGRDGVNPSSTHLKPRLYEAQNKLIRKSIDGTSNGSLTHTESGRLVECPYSRAVKKTPKLREEIVHGTRVKLCRLTPVNGSVQVMACAPRLMLQDVGESRWYHEG